MSKEIEIVVCGKCKGKGYIEEDILVDYHKRDYITKRHNCTSCNGSGRVVRTTEVTYKAFVAD